MLTRPADTPETDLSRAWQVERWLGSVRTLNVPLCLLLIPLVPGVSRLWTILLAVILAISDAGELWLLRFTPCPRRLRGVRALATAIDWQGALGVIALCAPFPAIPVPALLLIVLALTAGRYGRRGLLAATAAAWLTILALTTAQAWLLGIQDAAAERAGLGWVVLSGVMALCLGGLLGDAIRWPARSAAPALPMSTTAAEPAPIRSPLSPRERQVLHLLARQTDGELALKEIARELGISRNTVKTHVVHVARKLGAIDTSRPAILQAARWQGELPPPGPPPDQSREHDDELPPHGHG